MAFLFDTDAISETLRPRPDPGYLAWLDTVPRDEQFASAVTALHHDLELVTGNVRHFERIRELRIRPIRGAR